MPGEEAPEEKGLYMTFFGCVAWLSIINRKETIKSSYLK